MALFKGVAIKATPFSVDKHKKMRILTAIIYYFTNYRENTLYYCVAKFKLNKLILFDMFQTMYLKHKIPLRSGMYRKIRRSPFLEVRLVHQTVKAFFILRKEFVVRQALFAF